MSPPPPPIADGSIWRSSHPVSCARAAITCAPDFRRRLLDAVHIDRLNLGPVQTTKLNWLQPHEGNLVDFLFRARAFQSAAL